MSMMMSGGKLSEAGQQQGALDFGNKHVMSTDCVMFKAAE